METRGVVVRSVVLIFLLLLVSASTTGAQTDSPVLSDHAPGGLPDLVLPSTGLVGMSSSSLQAESLGRGGILPPVDLAHLKGDKAPQGVAASTLQSTWDWRTTGKITPVRQQGSCGSCYAFAAIGNFESKMLIDGAGTYDFSENNAKECNYYDTNCGGGNYYQMADLFSKKGTVLESCDPYQASNVDCKSTCPYVKTLLDWRIISGQVVPDTNVLKSYVQTYGPIFTFMYAGYEDAWATEFNDYDGSYTLHYTGPEDPKGYHCVLIVGWDDSLNHAGGTGGWIVKNSWGTDWGGICGYGAERGYFTIAYGSASIGMFSSYLHHWQDYDAYGELMYYDEGGWLGYGWGYGDTTGWGLAKFISDSDTNVTRVEFWTTDVTTDVDVYLYDDFNGHTLGNKLAEVADISYSEAGYHSVRLSSPVPVKRGDDVIAVVKFTNQSYTYPIPVDNEGPHAAGHTYGSYSGTAGSWQAMPSPNDIAIRLRTSTGAPNGPTLTGITPSNGYNTGVVHITNLAGSNFQAGASVKLVKPGQLAIYATNVHVLSGSRITCDFDLTGADPGWWDVVITNSDFQSYILSNGFRVRAESGVQDHFIYLPLVLRTWSQILDCVPDPPGESDNIGDALTVCSRQTVSGQVRDSDRDDVYRILTMADQQLTVSMNGSGGDADLYLYPPGTMDINTDPYVQRSDSLGNDEFIQGTVLVGGFWYIDVYSYEGTTDYSLKIVLSSPGVTETGASGSAQADPIRHRRRDKPSGDDQGIWNELH